MEKDEGHTLESKEAEMSLLIQEPKLRNKDFN
jgi:hypothetical protein